MSLKKLKLAQSLQGKLGSLLSHLPVSPAQLTLSSVLFAAAGFWLSIQHQIFPSLLLFVIAGAIDALDGALARAKKQSSDRGAYLDGITDRLVEFLFILSFFAYPIPPFVLPAGLSLICILFFGSAMSSFATAYAEHRHVADSKKIALQPGILPRAERLMLLFVSFLLIAYGPHLSGMLLFATALLSAITFLQRAVYYYKN
jgi:phosphatidylglycerophosphate synthase